MTYRLKKDLPKYKAGTEFRITNKGHLVIGDTVVYQKNELEKYPDILSEWFEKILEQPKTVWDLKTGDKCWQLITIPFGATAGRIFWHDTLEEKRSLGLIYLTEEECLSEIARMKAKQILLHDTKGFKPNWCDLHEDRFSVVFSLFCGERDKSHLGYLTVANSQYVISHEIYFATQADAEASIKAHPNEWKTYLGVEE